MYAVTAWMVHPLTCILVGTKMKPTKTKNFKVNQTHRLSLRTRFRLEEAKFILKRIEENERNGTPQKKDLSDRIKYTAMVEKLSALQEADNFDDTAEDIPNDVADHEWEGIFKTRYTMALVDDAGDMYKPVDKIHWRPLRLKIDRLIYPKKPKIMPIIEPIGVYQGYLIVKSNNKASKTYFFKCVYNLRFSVKGKDLKLIPASQLPTILRNKAIMEQQQQQQQQQSEGNNQTTATYKKQHQYEKGKNLLQLLAGIGRLTHGQRRKRAKFRKEVFYYEKLHGIKSKEELPPDELTENESDVNSDSSGDNSEENSNDSTSKNVPKRFKANPKTDFSNLDNNFKPVKTHWPEQTSTADSRKERNSNYEQHFQEHKFSINESYSISRCIKEENFCENQRHDFSFNEFPSTSRGREEENLNERKRNFAENFQESQKICHKDDEFPSFNEFPTTSRSRDAENLNERKRNFAENFPESRRIPHKDDEFPTFNEFPTTSRTRDAENLNERKRKFAENFQESHRISHKDDKFPSFNEFPSTSRSRDEVNRYESERISHKDDKFPSFNLYDFSSENLHGRQTHAQQQINATFVNSSSASFDNVRKKLQQNLAKKQMNDIPTTSFNYRNSGLNFPDNNKQSTNFLSSDDCRSFERSNFDTESLQFPATSHGLREEETRNVCKWPPLNNRREETSSNNWENRRERSPTHRTREETSYQTSNNWGNPRERSPAHRTREETFYHDRVSSSHKTREDTFHYTTNNWRNSSERSSSYNTREDNFYQATTNWRNSRDVSPPPYSAREDTSYRTSSNWSNNNFPARNSRDRSPNKSSQFDLEIAFIDRNHNEGRIYFDVWQKIEKLLRERLAQEIRQTNNNTIGQFEGSTFQNGFKIIKCENIASVNFLKHFAREQLNSAPNANYDAIFATDIPHRYMVKVCFTLNHHILEDDMATLKILQQQNDNFSSADWILVRSRARKHDNGKDFFLSVSAHSYKMLKRSPGEIRYGANYLQIVLLD